MGLAARVQRSRQSQRPRLQALKSLPQLGVERGGLGSSYALPQFELMERIKKTYDV